MTQLSDFDISAIDHERVAAIVIKCKQVLTPERRDYIKSQWEGLMRLNPNLPPCIVLDGGIDIERIYEKQHAS